MSAGARGVAVLSLVLAGGVGVVLGCGGGDSAVRDAKLPEGVRSQNLEHEACEESGHKVDKIDVNNDGKPDIKRVYDGAREICRISDLNRDGKPDMFEYYDAQGQVRRREADYDDNGVVNAIEYFEAGKLVRRELDTTNQGKIDTWDFFDAGSGNRTKRERDTTGDGRIDQWWSYEGERVVIVMDKNGDGMPEPESTIVLGANGSVIPTLPDGGAMGPPEVAGGSADGGLAASPAPPPPPPPAAPAATDGPRLDVPDAGVAGKPTRGGAKR